MCPLETWGLRSTWAAVCLAVLMLAQPAVQAQDVVAEDDAVVEEPAAVSVPWEPEVVEPRTAEGATYWQRQSSDAFVDPDQRQNLVPKYYFVLPPSFWPAADPRFTDDLRRGPEATVDELNVGGALGGPRRPALQWLDYQSGPKTGLLAVLSIPQPETGQKQPAKLSVQFARRENDKWMLGVDYGQRELPAAELPSEVPGGLLLDTFDYAPDNPVRKALMGRVIAVLKRIDGRDAVDFYGERLNPEGDCRLWLAPAGHPLGNPTGIRFVRIPIKRDTGKLAEVDVLAVAYVDSDANNHLIAFDFPICSTTALAQMRDLAEKLAPKNNKPAPRPATDQATKLLGEDLADELARRLVNGTYK